jgi:hypothetical protein
MSTRLHRTYSNRDNQIPEGLQHGKDRISWRWHDGQRDDQELLKAGTQCNGL